jgi:putative transposase
MKCERVFHLRKTYSIRKMCEALGLCHTTYYSWIKTKKRQESKKEEKVLLIEKVEKVFIANKRVYGYRKMQHALAQEGISLSMYRLRKMMRENGMYPQLVKKFKPYSRTKSPGRYSPDYVQQKFKTDGFNRVWAGDITYIKTKLGWVYLSVVMDLHNREIIGYSVSKEMNAELVRRSLGNAITQKEGNSDTIFHSDRGVQYASESFQKMLNQYEIKSSMSRSGCPFDNSCVEGFFASMKKEWIYKKDYVSIDEVEKDLFEYIELFYNRKRLHKTLGYLSPVQYRMKVGGGKPA